MGVMSLERPRRAACVGLLALVACGAAARAGRAEMPRYLAPAARGGTVRACATFEWTGGGVDAGSRASVDVSRAYASRSMGTLGPGERAEGGEPSSIDAERRKENLRVIGLSLLLPGLAQLRQGQRAKGTAFLAAEAVFWGGALAGRLQGNERRDSSYEMLEIYAGVSDPRGRTSDYYRLVGILPSSDIWDDEIVRRDARRLYPDDLEARERYYEANRTPRDRAWTWESDAARDRYREKRSESQRAYRRSRNFVGLLLGNRMLAMVDAVLHRDMGEHTELKLEPNWGKDKLSARIVLAHRLP